MASPKIILLSHPLSEKTPGYRGRTPFQRSIYSSTKQGHFSCFEKWSLFNHSGTHVDGPKHFFKTGKSLDQLDFNTWFFKNPILIHIPVKQDEIIDLKKLKHIPFKSDLVLIKTHFEQYRSKNTYWRHNPGISPTVGEWLRRHRPNVRAIGFDFISLSPYEHRSLGRLAHQTFLNPNGTGHPILIIEDMHLSSLQSPLKKVIVSPLIVKGADAAPATIFGIS